jgi:hypothetical protein
MFNILERDNCSRQNDLSFITN